MQKRTIWKKSISILTAAALLASCAACTQSSSGTGGTGSGTPGAAGGSSVYEPTGENEKLELTMNLQPESSYWFPQQLLEWNASEDKDLPYNVSTVPLAKRADKAKLNPVNGSQNKDTEIMAISIMNGSTSGNSPHGLNKSNANTFSYWQYVDKLVYWGGSSGEGLIVAPSPDVVDAGHKNGVPVIGTIFFPQAAHGGKLEWLDTFLQKDSAGNFPILDKLVEVAQTYGFDGWFLNQESEGTEEAPLTAEHAKLTQEFIKAFKEKAPELELVYYDSMTNSGKMDWQNALTDENVPFMKSADGKAMADSMFLNFWWTNDSYADKELLKSSAQKAGEAGIDPYSLYAGVDVQSEGYLTPIRWNLLSPDGKSTYTSLGLYCPSWTYFSAEGMEDFWAKESAMWVNSKGDPSAEISYSSDTQWRGVSSFAVERTPITAAPFTTNFNMGNGYSFYKNGEIVSKMDWNNRSLSDVLPTYRYIIQNEGSNSLTAGLDVANAWYGGNSLKLRGKMEKGKASTIKLYSADLAVPDNTVFTTIAKAGVPTKLSAEIELDDGSKQILNGDKKLGKEWTTVTFDMSALKGKTIRTLSYQITAEEESSDYEMNFGNITIAAKEDVPQSTVSAVTVDEKEFDEDALYAGVRLSWTVDTPAEYYEVYRINQNKTKSLLGVSNNTSFYINTLPRTDETNKSTFEVVPVTKFLADGKSAQVEMEWPNNSIPRANFTADNTMVAPGGTVNFSSLCSPNTETVQWSFPGADTETAEGEKAAVTYSKAGVYDVKVTAKNKSGETEKSETAYIVVSDKAAGGVKLLSQGAKTEATAFVNDNEAPQFAVDGDVTKKWCATGTPPHELTIDLGAVNTISAVDISHAEAGGEGPDMNTKAYVISVSEDGAEYKDVISITKNMAGTTHDVFAPVKARFVKFSVVKPTQGSDTAARIYEVQVFGLEGIE